jgi:predicted O-methyltransferase YrrM
VVLIREYIKYKLKSQGKHDIHSPFVFDFVTRCLKTKINQKDLDLIKSIRKQLLTNSKLINVSDFGAGSKKLGKQRTIKQIFKNASSKGIYSKLLYQLANHYQPQNILELGTSLGYGTVQFALGSPNSNTVTIDACTETQEVAKNHLSDKAFSSIEFISNTFDNYFQTLQNKRFDLVFIDGHHNGQALLSYMEVLKKFTHNDTIFIIDDIRWSEDMLAAWNEIIKNKEYHLTLDLFKVGIVIKRPQQAKEHFTIKLKGVLFSM